MKQIIVILILFTSSVSFAIFPQDGVYTTKYVFAYGTTELSIGASSDLVKIVHTKMSCDLDELGEASHCLSSNPIKLEGKLSINKSINQMLVGTTIVFKVEGTDYGVVSYNGYSRSRMTLIKYNSKGEVIFSTPLCGRRQSTTA